MITKITFTIENPSDDDVSDLLNTYGDRLRSECTRDTFNNSIEVETRCFNPTMVDDDVRVIGQDETVPVRARVRKPVEDITISIGIERSPF